MGMVNALDLRCQLTLPCIIARLNLVGVRKWRSFMISGIYRGGFKLRNGKRIKEICCGREFQNMSR